MLTLWAPGGGNRFCDGHSRRSFLRIGGLAMGGVGLPGLLSADSRAGAASPVGASAAGATPRGGSAHKSVIMIYLAGGLAHQDTFDLKLGAPEGIRGEFKPIATRLPGVQVGEHLPRIAGLMDKVAVIRSIVGLRDEHSSFQNVTGFPMGQSQREGKPSFGSMIARVQGSVDPVVPPFVDLFPVMQHRPYNSPGPGFLGHTYRAARMEGDDLALLKPPADVPPTRFDRRRALLDQFDHFRRSLDNADVAGMEGVYRRAFDVLTSDKVARALDLSREDPRLRDRYGPGWRNTLGDAAPMHNDQFLVARRLVEAGARVVTVAYGFWDTHGNNFDWLRKYLPAFDQGVSALVEDIHNRGLDRDVTVVVWGEFGRTPKINKNAGRDHWPAVNCALLAGGGMRTGQVIGATDRHAAYVVDHPVSFQNVFATLYHNLGIDPATAVSDRGGRPMTLLDEKEPIRELI